MEPFGLSVEFESDENNKPIMIAYHPADLTETEKLAKHASSKQHITSILKGTSLAMSELLTSLEERGVKENTARKTIARMKEQKLLTQQPNGYLELKDNSGHPPLKGVS